MSTIQKIEEDFKIAYKSKQEVEIATLRLIKSALLKLEKDIARELTEDDVIGILSSLSKKHKDSIDAYTQGGRQDLVDMEKAQLAIVTKYLPQQCSEEEVRQLVTEIVNALPDDKKGNFGAVMGVVMGKLKGKADGTVVNRIVKEVLG